MNQRSRSLFGPDNPNWRGGVTKGKCIDCGKEISKYHQRCKSCARKGELHPNYKGGPPKCPDCGKPVSRSHKGSRCRECWYKFNRAEKNAAFRGGSKVCVDCGKELAWTKPSSPAKRCKECHEKYAQREKHPRWKGGILTIEQALRKIKKFKAWIKTIQERDGFTCRKCGRKGKGLDTHHIVPLSYYIEELKRRNPDANDEEILSMAKRYGPIWDEKNGMALCHKCHMEEHKAIED